MFRHLCVLLIIAVTLSGMVACKPKPTAAQLQAVKVDAFRKRQKIEAIKAYTALITKFPDSEYAPRAQERLNVLGPLPAATPAVKK